MRFEFRLVSFAVYASLLSLPTAAQDSLCSVLGLTSTAGLSPARHAKLFLAQDQYTRRIIGFAVHQGDLNGIAICRMFNAIVARKKPPKYLSSDNDPLFEFHRWKANLRILEIEELKTIPYVPISHPFVERLIGTIRRELLDRSLFWNSIDLQRKLNSFQSYFNTKRSHQSLDALTPTQKSENFSSILVNIKKYNWKSHCNGLFQLPIAA